MLIMVTSASPGWPMPPIVVMPGMKPPAPTMRKTTPKIIANVRVFIKHLPTGCFFCLFLFPFNGKNGSETSRSFPELLARHGVDDGAARRFPGLGRPGGDRRGDLGAARRGG